MNDLIQLHKEYLMKKFGKEPSEVDKREVALGIVGEVGEIVLNSDFLSWKTKNDKDNILEETTDILFFVLEMYLIYGVESFDEVIQMYKNKMNKNLSRGDHKSW